MASMSGFTGNKNLLEADEYRYLTDDLGENYEVMNLYFKPYPCCRWAHPAIDACVSLMQEKGIKKEDIEKVVIKTFNRATLLSKIEPKTADEAQYNIAYPVATAIVHGTFGIDNVWEENLKDPDTLEMMKKLFFETDEELDKKFPAQRICRAEIYTKNGSKFISHDCVPTGEAYENIKLDWICEKFLRITAPVISKNAQQNIIASVTEDENISIRNIVNIINTGILN